MKLDRKPGLFFFWCITFHLRKTLFIMSLLLVLEGQNADAQITDSRSLIIPGPEPFSLDADSAIDCISLLKNNRFIEIDSELGKSDIVEVQSVWSYFLGVDTNYPEGHQLRYDIIVNGVPLSWNKSFIEYGGKMLNLRLLFLYRNQYPPKDLEYRNSH